MAISHKNLAHSESEYVRTYENIKGVDFSSDCALSDGRLPYMENLYRDYDAGSDYIIESVPGYRSIFSLGKRINAMHLQKISDDEEYIVVHAGDKLYRFSVKERDSGATLSPIATVKNTRSSGFSFENNLYVLDGEKITAVSKDGTVGEIAIGGFFSPYVPTTFINSREHEQLNLLTDTFKERYTPKSLGEIAHASDGLKYEITDGQKHICSVIGVDPAFSGELYIPSRVKIGDEVYSVEEISSGAFANNQSISVLITNDGLLSIGESAFYGCTALTRAVIASSVKTVKRAAFSSCDMLTTVYIGSGISEIGSEAFEKSSALKNIYYALGESDFANVDGSEGLADITHFYTRYDSIRIELYLHTPTVSVSSVTVNGTPFNFSVREDGERISSVIMDIDYRHSLIGSTIEIDAIAKSTEFAESENGEDVRRNKSLTLDEGAIIKNCTRAAIFDGRIFLSGNPELPNTVFFSSKGRGGNNGGLYFGAYDYETDGVGGYGVISMMAAQDTLFVFKSADDGGGSIYYHTHKSTGNSVRPSSYPVSYAHSGVCALGASTVFYDDPIFVSDIGICGFDKNAGTVGRDVVCRSHNVNQRLLAEKLSEIRMTVWKGYLVCAVGPHIYLADSRQIFRHSTGGREYEWFFMNDVGYASEYSLVYYYHSIPSGIYGVHETPDKRIPTELRVVSSFDPSDMSNVIYYVIINKKRYRAYITGEREPIDFSATTEVISTGELLFVGCENGTVLVFNNDMRGKAPPRLTENDANFNTEDFEARMGRRLHSDFYDFAGIAPKYVIKTGWDDCDIPYLSKNTVSASLSIKCKCENYSCIKCEQETDRSEYPDLDGFAAHKMSFDDFHFDSLTFNTHDGVTVASKTAAKKWTEQQTTLYSHTYHAPIGIYSISYRFKINGRIK